MATLTRMSLFLIMMVAFVLPLTSRAQSPSSATPAVSSGTNHFETCAAQNNITLPAKGSGQHLTPSEKQIVFSCMHEARHAAFAQCAASVDFIPGDGQKPSDTQKQSIDQCMTTAGFVHHHHGHGSPSPASI